MKTRKLTYNIPILFVLLSVFLFTIPIILRFFQAEDKAYAAWFDDTFQYRVPITIGNTGSAATNQKVKLDISTTTFVTNGQIQTDCDDVRFTDINGTLLKYFYDQAGGACNTASTDFYVLIPEIAGSSQDTIIYMYYGNPEARRGSQQSQLLEATFTPTSGPTQGSEEDSPSPVVYIPMDEKTGTNRNDRTGNNHDASATTGAPVWRSNEFCMKDGCMYFDGVDDSVNIANHNRIDFNVGLSTGFTMMAWIRPNGAGEGTGGSPFIKSTTYLRVSSLSNGMLTLSANVQSTTPATASVASILPNNQWSHVALAWSDDADDELSIYLNGKLIATSTDGSGALTADTSLIYIGGVNTNNFEGTVDDFKVYNYERTEEQIATDMVSIGGTQGSGSSFSFDQKPLSDGLMGYWKLDETSGNPVDSSGNGYTLTNTGATTFTGARFFNGSEHVPASSQHHSYVTSIPGVKTVSFWVNPDSTTNYYFCLTVDRCLTSTSGTLEAGSGFSEVSEVFTTTGTWTAPVRDVFVETWGGGGAGGGKSGIGAASGGGGGAYAASNLTLVPGRSYSYTIGTGVSGTSGVGSNGNPTYWDDGTLVYADYGRGGSNALGGGGSGGLASNSIGETKYSGGNGGNGSGDQSGGGGCAAGSEGAGNNGPNGSACVKTNDFGGAGGRGRNISTGNGSGFSGAVAGGGGGGARSSGSSFSGGAGAAGLIRVNYTAPNPPTIYVNGVQSSTIIADTWQLITITSEYPVDTSNLFIGRAGSNYFDGTMDDFRIYNKTLSPKDVERLYQDGLGPTTYLRLEDKSTSITDSSSNGLGGTGTGTDTEDWITGKRGLGLDFDGSSGEYVQMTDNALYDLNTTRGYSWCVWLNTDDLSTNSWRTVWSQETTGTTYFYIYAGTLTDSFWGPLTNGIAVGWFADGSSNFVSRPTLDNVISTGEWYHVCVTYDGGLSQADRFTIYVDGVDQTDYAEATDQSAGTINNISPDDIRLGSNAAYSEHFDGRLDEFRYYLYSLTPSQVVMDMNSYTTSTNTTIGSKVLEWKLDELTQSTANSTVADGPNGTISNATWATKTNCKINNCLSFDGTGDVVTLATASDDAIDFSGSAPFSASAWVYITTMPGSGEKDAIITKWDETSTLRGYRLYVENDDADTTGNFEVELYDESANQSITASQAVDSLSQNTWYHVAFTFNGGETGQAGDLSLFVDAEKVAINTTNSSFLGVEDVAVDFTVGDYDATDAVSTNTGFTGYIDEVHVYNNVLTAEAVQVDQNTSSNTTFGTQGVEESTIVVDGTIPNPIGYWKFDENTGLTTVYDNSGNGKNLTMSGFNDETWVAGKSGSALKFDGNDDELTRADDDSFDFGTSDSFSISLWVNFTSDQTEDVNLIGKDTNPGWRLRYSFSNDDIFLQIRDGTNSPSTDTLNSTLRDGTWHHIVAVRDVTNDQLRIYADGILQETPVTDSTTSTLNSTADLAIGDSSRNFEGIIDEVKIFSSALTQAQVRYIYNRGLPIAHFRFDECQGDTLNDASGNSYTAAWYGPTSGSQTQSGTCQTAGTSWGNGITGKFNASLNFDGTNDYAYVSGGLPELRGASQFSVSFWIKPTTLATQDGIIGQWVSDGSSSTSNVFSIRTTNADADEFFIFIGNGGDPGTHYDTTSGLNLTTSEWQHITLIYDGTQASNDDRIVLYKNNQLISTSTTGTINTTTNTGTATDFNMAATLYAGVQNFYDGQMDDVRVYNYVLSQDQIQRIMNDNAAFRFGPEEGSP